MEPGAVGNRAGRRSGRSFSFLVLLLPAVAGGLLLPSGAHSAALTVSIDGPLNRAVQSGDTVTLSGSATGGVGAKTYAWTQMAQPPVTLDGADRASASFTAPAVTSGRNMVFWLTATDENGRSGTSPFIVVTVSPRPLRAEAGAAQTVVRGTPVTLSGSATGGVGTKSYAWAQTGGSPTVTLNGADRASAGFTAPAVSASVTLTFRLTATAGSETATDTVAVTVTPPPLSVEAGADQTVVRGTPVMLSGSATRGEGTRSYAWEQAGGSPLVTLSDADRASAGFTAPTVSENTALTFRLTVTDSLGSATDTVTVTVAAAALSAAAGPDRTVASRASATLSGSAAGGGGPRSYAWAQTGGSPTVTLSNANRASAGFTAPSVKAATELEFTLTVTDSSGTATDAVTVTVEAEPPTVTAVSLASRPRSGDTYRQGETIRAQVWLSGLAVVTGSPRLALGVGAQTRTMSYTGLDRARVLEFGYAVQASDADADGVSIGAGALSLPPGATLRGEVGGTVLLGLTGHAISNAPGHRVDGAQNAASPLPDLNACPRD